LEPDGSLWVTNETGGTFIQLEKIICVSVGTSPDAPDPSASNRAVFPGAPPANPNTNEPIVSNNPYPGVYPDSATDTDGVLDNWDEIVITDDPCASNFGSSGNRVGEDILVGCEIESYTAGY
jgi:hypothetical protein